MTPRDRRNGVGRAAIGAVCLACGTALLAGNEIPGRRAGRAVSTAQPAVPAAATKLLPDDGAAAPAPAWYRLESGPVDFGDVLPGEPAEIPGGIRARVFADGDWSLSIVPRTPLRTLDDGVGESGRPRLSWRGEASGGFAPIEARPVVVAAGKPTGPTGRLVVLDLQLALAESDGLGAYECRLDLVLDSRSTWNGARSDQPSIQRIGEKR